MNKLQITITEYISLAWLAGIPPSHVAEKYRGSSQQKWIIYRTLVAEYKKRDQMVQETEPKGA